MVNDGPLMLPSEVISAQQSEITRLRAEVEQLREALRPFAATMAKKQGFTTEQLKDGMTHVLLSTTEGYIQQYEVPVSEVLMKLPPRPKEG